MIPNSKKKNKKKRIRWTICINFEKKRKNTPDRHHMKNFCGSFLFEKLYKLRPSQKIPPALLTKTRSLISLILSPLSSRAKKWCKKTLLYQKQNAGTKRDLLKPYTILSFVENLFLHQSIFLQETLFFFAIVVVHKMILESQTKTKPLFLRWNYMDSHLKSDKLLISGKNYLPLPLFKTSRVSVKRARKNTKIIDD